MHKLPDILHMDLNVLGSMSLNWISGDSNGALIVTIDDSGKILFEPTFSKYPLQPQTLSSCIHNSSILSLYIWECYGTMLLNWTFDWYIYKHEHMSWSRLSIFFVTFPITINKSNLALSNILFYRKSHELLFLEQSLRSSWMLYNGYHEADPCILKPH